MSRPLVPPSLGADPHEGWRLRQKPQDVKPLPKKKEEPGVLEKIGDGLDKAATGTRNALVNNENLHQGVEIGARGVWETSKTVGREMLRQLNRSKHQSERYGQAPGLAQYAEILLNRYKNPREAYERIPEYRREIEDLARKIREQRDMVHGKH